MREVQCGQARHCIQEFQANAVGSCVTVEEQGASVHTQLPQGRGAGLHSRQIPQLNGGLAEAQGLQDQRIASLKCA